jgi:hypothetical protein
MIRLFGMPVTLNDAQHLVATLVADGTPHAVSAAAMVQKGVDKDLPTVALGCEERDAILSVLEHPPEGLAALRGVFARDQADRNYWARP